MPALLRSFALGVVLTIPLAACSKSAPRQQPEAASATANATVSVDQANGRRVFAANCAQCHGAHGIEGGVGPGLHAEKTRKNQAGVVAWIKDPDPPMPKLFPSPLTERDVDDVAAYVESL